MDVQTILSFAKEFLVLLLVIGALFAYAFIRGNRALISLILGLYIALLVSLKFPYYDVMYRLASHGDNTPLITIVIFAIFTALGTVLFERLLPHDYREMYEGISKKVILVVLATILVMAYSYHVLPVTNIIDPGSAISALFGPPQYFFWLLIIPLLGLFFV